MEKKWFEEKNVCDYCHIAFDKSMENCPVCGRKVKSDTITTYQEGAGRMYGAGGAACDYCPFCYGSADWCPMMD